jgi:hypothetical protein
MPADLGALPGDLAAAGEWMDIAQAYAGAPGAGRPPKGTP